MDAEQQKADLEALRGDLPRLRQLVRDRAEGILQAEAEGASEAVVVELRRRHEVAVGLLRRQREDIAMLEAELANGELAEDPVALALAVVRRARRRFLSESDELEDALLARLMERRSERVLRHAH